MSARDELLEAARFLEAHGFLPVELATPAVRAVAEPMLPGELVDIVVALRAAGTPKMPISKHPQTNARPEESGGDGQ